MKRTKKIRFGFVFSILLLGILTPLLFNTTLVKAQNSFIEVYAFDAYTLNPIVGAELYLYDDMWMFVDFGIADVTGFYNFTGLNAGSYYVEFFATSYPYNQTFVTLSYDGDSQTIVFLAEPSFIPGTGFIEVYVYDSSTMSPISGAYVELMTDDWTYITDDITDAYGFCNLTGLGAGSYWVSAEETDYELDDQYVMIDYDGEGEYIEFYLDKIYTPGIGYIEVEVYGSDTLALLPFADVYLYNDNWYSITSGVADASGFYNFTGLGAGTYIVEAITTGYFWNDTMVTLDYDGEGKFIQLYIPPEPTPGDGYIEVYVYDQITLLPIENVDLNLMTEYFIYVDFGMTDVSGFYNFTYLGVGTYIIEAHYYGYQTSQTYVTIDYDGEGECVEIYLSPIVRTIEILSPTDSETVEGGSVLVMCYISEVYDFDYLEVYVNSIYITEVQNFAQESPYEFIVPVFLNGSNVIAVVGYWYDASSAMDSVTIDSIDVVPIVNIREGDIANYYYNATVSMNIEAFWNFTFVEWIAPFYMNTSVYFYMWDDSGPLGEYNYYLSVNVLNGYVPYDPTGQFDQNHLFPFCSLQPNVQLGDVAPVVPWDDLVVVTGSMPWIYTDVWVLETYTGSP